MTPAMNTLHAAPASGDDALRVLRRIESARRPLIVSHIRLDGDALGSELGLWHLLRERGAAVAVRYALWRQRLLAMSPGRRRALQRRLGLGLAGADAATPPVAA